MAASPLTSGSEFEQTLPGAVDLDVLDFLKDIEFDDFPLPGLDNGSPLEVSEQSTNFPNLEDPTSLQQQKQSVGLSGLENETDSQQQGDIFSFAEPDTWQTTDFSFSLPEHVETFWPATVEPQHFDVAFPGCSEGPYYHAEVGWYYPAPVSSTTFSTHAAHEHANIVQEPLRMDLLPPYSLSPPASITATETSHKSQQQSHVRSNAQRKRKASILSTCGPRKAQKGFKRSRVLQYCVCETKAKIPRPKNAFILYRSFHAQSLLKAVGGNNPKLSIIIGKRWKAESAEVKAKFYSLAALEKKRHAERYPGYVYKPGKSKASQFGDESCTCGAFQVNMEAEQQREKHIAAGIFGDEGDSTDTDVFGDDEIVVSHTPFF